MMSFNHQLIEHEKRDKLTPFSRSMFQPYTFPSRNHAKTNAYHNDFVSRSVLLRHPKNCTALTYI